MGDGYGGTPAWPRPQQVEEQRQRATMSTGMSAAALAPVPKSCAISLVSLPHEFQRPAKRIASSADVDRFNESQSGLEFLGFVVALSESVIGVKISDACQESLSVKALVGILQDMTAWIDEIPPSTQALRYGNPAYREWHARLAEKGPKLVEQVVGSVDPAAVDELFPYLADSFGNATRIDYGTGHEVNFAAFLLCLSKLGIFGPEDHQAIVMRVFAAYLDLMRKLQLTYWLEPAGSHGVWGLDDYHFLPFIFGAAQLVDHKYMKPKSIHNQDILDNFAKDYYYLRCVEFVKTVKKGRLAEHSPMIDDISGVPSWSKVYTGLLKMYRAEVLSKFPIMQHFLFGSLIKWE